MKVIIVAEVRVKKQKRIGIKSATNSDWLEGIQAKKKKKTSMQYRKVEKEIVGCETRRYKEGKWRPASNDVTTADWYGSYFGVSSVK